MKKSRFKKDISKRENMAYGETKDEYTCHNNKKLKPVGIKTRESKSGYKAEVTIYECESCENCEFKSKCTKAITYKLNFLLPLNLILKTDFTLAVTIAYAKTEVSFSFNRFFYMFTSVY
jgi:hypothetical protein